MTSESTPAPEVNTNRTAPLGTICAIESMRNPEHAPVLSRVAGSSVPANLLNTGACSGFRIDSIAQIVPSGAVRFVLTSGAGVDSLVIATAPRLPDAQWGYTYSLPLKSACGTGALTWSLDSGGPPPGTGGSAAGVVRGPPADTGTYTFAAKLKAGADSAR